MKIYIARGPADLWAKIKEWNLEDEIARRERIVERNMELWEKARAEVVKVRQSLKEHRHVREQ